MYYVYLISRVCVYMCCINAYVHQHTLFMAAASGSMSWRQPAAARQRAAALAAACHGGSERQRAAAGAARSHFARNLACARRRRSGHPRRAMASSSHASSSGLGRGAPEPAAKAQRTVKEEPTGRLKITSWNVGAVRKGQRHQQWQQIPYTLLLYLVLF